MTLAPILTCFLLEENKDKDECLGRNALCMIPEPAIHGRTGDPS